MARMLLSLDVTGNQASRVPCTVQQAPAQWYEWGQRVCSMVATVCGILNCCHWHPSCFLTNLSTQEQLDLQAGETVMAEGKAISRHQTASLLVSSHL